MIKLFWCPRTRASRILWLLEEMEEDFELVHIDLRDESSRSSAEFLACSPMSKVPALSDGEVRLAESSAIGLYLADRYPSSGLAPKFDHPQRGDYLYWMIFTPAVMEPAMAEKFNGWEVSRGTSGWGDFDLMIETLSRGVRKGPWLLGDRFSTADVLVGSTVNFMQMFGILPDLPELTEYLNRCLARPAYIRALARDSDQAS